MKRTTEVHAVEMTRKIRDVQAKELRGKSEAEIMRFYNRAVKRTGGSKRASGHPAPPARQRAKF